MADVTLEQVHNVVEHYERSDIRNSCHISISLVSSVK